MKKLTRISFTCICLFFLVSPIASAAPFMYVANYDSNEISVHNPASGAYIKTLARASATPTDIVFAPNGKLYVSHHSGVDIFDPETGNHLGLINEPDPTYYVDSLAINGNDLYAVFSLARNNAYINQYALDTGKDMGHFASVPAMTQQMVFRPDGYLYSASYYQGTVQRYDAFTGEYVDTIISGLSGPRALGFDVEGNLYVSSWRTNIIKIYDPATFNQIDTIAHGKTSAVGDIILGNDGDLYMAGRGSDTLLRYDPDTGQMIVLSDDSHLSGPIGIAFGDTSLAPVPLPKTITLLGFGLLGIIGIIRRNKRSR